MNASLPPILLDEPATPLHTENAATHDTIHSARVSLIRLPLPRPISDAKVLTRRQQPLTEVALVVAQSDCRQSSPVPNHSNTPPTEEKT